MLLSVAHAYAVILLAAGLVGLGSAIFHPESSRIARLASGGRYGFAQSVFQVGGNFGSAMGPMLAALIVVPFGQPSIAGFRSSRHRDRDPVADRALVQAADRARRKAMARHPNAPSPRRTALAIAILIVLVFSKFIYMASLTSYYTFFLIHKFDVSTQTSQIFLFMFLAATAVGTFSATRIGDRIGAYVIGFRSSARCFP